MTAFPLLPLRDIVVFPGMVVPLFVGRDKSVAALEAAMEGDKDIFLLSQLDPGCDDPARSDLYEVGVVAQVLGARLLEWVTGIEMGKVLAAESVQAQAWLVGAVHVALGLVVAVAIL